MPSILIAHGEMTLKKEMWIVLKLVVFHDLVPSEKSCSGVTRPD